MNSKLLALLAGAVIFGGCAKTVEPSLVVDVCQRAEGTQVVVEGFLVLPNFMDTTIDQKTGIINYELFFAEVPDNRNTAIKTSVSGTSKNEANHIAELSPYGYTQRDLRIFTDTGKTVGSLDRVKVSGEIVKGPNSCVLKIYKIESP